MLRSRIALARGVAWLLARLEEETPDALRAMATSVADSARLVRSALRTAYASGTPMVCSLQDRDLRALIQEHAVDDDIRHLWDGLSAVATELVAGQRPDGRLLGLAPSPTSAADDDDVAQHCRSLLAIAATLTPTFDDPAINRTFWRDGFTFVDLLSPDAVASLREAHARIDGVSPAGFYSTWFRPLEIRVATDRVVRDACEARLAEVLPGYRMVFGSFMSKGYEGDTTFPIHQDPSIVDESRWVPLTFWIPLVDVDVPNGCIHVAPGSHLQSSLPRPSFAEFKYPDQKDELRTSYLRPVPMLAGQALVFHSALIHYSPSNHSRSLRVASAGVAVPCEAQVVFCCEADDRSELREYAVDDSFYLQMQQSDSTDDLRLLRRTLTQRHPLELSRLPRINQVHDILEPVNEAWNYSVSGFASCIDGTTK